LESKITSPKRATRVGTDIALLQVLLTAEHDVVLIEVAQRRIGRDRDPVGHHELGRPVGVIDECLPSGADLEAELAAEDDVVLEVDPADRRAQRATGVVPDIGNELDTGFLSEQQ
jgi:hypothetical protein